MASLATMQHLPHLEIVDRVRAQFPMVESVLGFAQTRYVALKNYSDLSKATFGRAESTLVTVLDTVAPVIGRFEQPIHYAVNLAVRSLDTASTSIASISSSLTTISKTSQELKTQTITTIAQTRSRLNSLKDETIEKVHTVLAVPGNFIPLMNNIFSAGDYILDYILPPPEGVKSMPAPGNAAYPVPDAESADYAFVFRALIARMKQFTERVHERLSIYSREKWFPGLLNSVGTFKGGVENSVSGAKKFLNGHSNPTPKTNGQVPSLSPTSGNNSAAVPEKPAAPAKPNKKNKAQKNKNTADDTERPIPNGDAGSEASSQQQQQQQPL